MTALPDDSSDAITIRRVEADDAATLAPQLVGLLQDAVAGGASLGFWPPLADANARDYWRDVRAEVARGARWLLVAERAGAVVGSVQLAPSPRQNAPHRAEAQKLMTHSAARRQGIGRALMRAAESLARDNGRTLLVLDTNTDSDAVRFYRAVGYSEVGSIPDYSVEADGSGRATTIFYKALASERA
jgi:ribosomal protein S18 acetylase RimI-like enzyme